MPKCNFNKVAYFQNTFSIEHLWMAAFGIITCFKNVTITPVFILKLIFFFFKQNKLNKDHGEVNMRTFNWNLKILSLYMSYSKETNENAARKQS